MIPERDVAARTTHDPEDLPQWAARDALHLATQNVQLAVDEYLVGGVDANTVREVVSELLDELAGVPEAPRSDTGRLDRA